MSSTGSTSQTRQRTGSDESDVLVGRDAELQELQRRIADHRRVVVTGPPGIGKTALVEAHLATRGETWAHSDLRETPESLSPLRRLARDIGAEVRPDAETEEILETVDRALEARADGLWLDGVERLADHPEWFERFQERGPDIPLVVSSRRDIRLRSAARLELEALHSAAAVALFERRAREIDPGFEVDASNREQVRDLVTRLDCFPLSVELAAARIGVLSPEMMLERLDQRFELLEVPDDQRESLREAIEWSWELLDERGQSTLRQLALFAGDFPLEAAEHVVEHADETPSIGLINTLDELVKSSWLKTFRHDDGSKRFELWESLRSFARDRLEETGAVDAVGARYADFYLTRGLDAASAVPTASGREALDWLERERHHFLDLFDRFTDRDPRRAAEAIWILRWNARFGGAEELVVERLAEAGESLVDALDAPWATRLLMVRGELELRRGNRELASDLLEKSQQFADRVDDPELRGEAAVVSTLALAYVDPDAAEDRLRAVLEEALQRESPVLEGRCRERLGFIQLQTFRLEEARQSFRRARDLLSTHANPLLAAPSTTGLAYVALRTGHGTGAAAGFGETVRIYEDAEHEGREAEARFNHAVALHAEGKLDSAQRELERALEIWSGRGATRYDAIGEARLGLVLAERRAFEEARQHFEAAVAAAQEQGDWHNRGIAESGLGILRLLEAGPGASVRGLDEAIEQMDFAADPDAAAAALATSAVLAARRDRRGAVGDAVDRIAAIRSLISSDDAYLGRVLDGLHALGATWAEQLLGDQNPEAPGLANRSRRRETLRRFAPSIFEDAGQTREESRQLANPYLRLLFDGAAAYLEGKDRGPRFLTEARPEEAEGRMMVHRAGHWFAVDGGEPTSLMSRQPLRRILKALVDSHLEPGEPGRSVDELIEAGWPDAYVTDDAGKNRVYTAIRTLRDMGLEGYLITGDQGYCFDASVAVECTEEGLDAVRN